MGDYVVKAISRAGWHPYYLCKTRILGRYKFTSNVKRALRFSKVSEALIYINGNFSEIRQAYQNGDFKAIGVGLAGDSNLLQRIK